MMDILYVGRVVEVVIDAI